MQHKKQVEDDELVQLSYHNPLRFIGVALDDLLPVPQSIALDGVTGRFCRVCQPCE
jgi:hypothetical protein